MSQQFPVKLAGGGTRSLDAALARVGQGFRVKRRAQSACKALRNAETRGESLRIHDKKVATAFGLDQRSCIARTVRIVLSSRKMGAAITPKTSSAWRAKRYGKAAHPSASPTQWPGAAAGTSTTAWRATERWTS